MRALCLVSAGYPLEHAALAEALAATGASVHVVARATAGTTPLERGRGVTVHRVEVAAATETAAATRSWAAAASDAFDAIDRLVHFDAVLAPARRAEGLLLCPGSLAPLLLLVDALPGEITEPPAACDPDAAALSTLEELARSRADGVVVVPPDCPGPARAREVAAAVADAAKAARPRAQLPRQLLQPSERGPRLGVIVIGSGDRAALERSVASVTEHAKVPTQLVALDTAEVLSTTTAAIAVPTASRTPGEARNFALGRLEGDLDAVALLVAGSEVTARWWEPAYGRLDASPELFEVADGMAGRQTALRLLRASTFSAVGHFDEHPARDPDVELARRAARFGLSSSGILSGRVLAADAPGAAVALAATATPGASPFVGLCAARAVLEEPSLLATWSAAFTAEDRTVLALYGPGEEPAAYVAALTAAAETVGFDLEDGPKLLVKLPPVVDAALERSLGDEALALLGGEADPRFPALLAFGEGEQRALRLLAARLWRAQSGVAA